MRQSVSFARRVTKRGRQDRDNSVFTTTLPVEVTDMILQQLDAPSLAAARLTSRFMADVGKRHIHTDDCFSRAMFRVHMSRLVADMIAAAKTAQPLRQPDQDFFADEDLDALMAEMSGNQPEPSPVTSGQAPFTQLQAGNVLNRHLIVLTPTATGWIDPSGMVTFTRHGPMGQPSSVSFRAPGRPIQTGTLQPMGTPGIDTYSAWLQQVVHCRIAASPDARGRWDQVVPAVFPFAEGPLGRVSPGPVPCHVIQLTSETRSVAPGPNGDFVPGPESPFLNTLWRQIHDQNQGLIEDDAPDVPDMLTDADVVTIMFQVVSLLADLHGQPRLTRGVHFLALNNTSDIAFVRDAHGRPLARVTSFGEACIELTDGNAGRVRVCQTWSADRTVLHDLATFLTELHFIVRNSEAFPRTRGILRQLHVRAMYRVFGGHIQASSVRPISDLTMRLLLSALNAEITLRPSLPVVF